MTHFLILTALLSAAATPALAQSAPAAPPAQGPQPVSRIIYTQRINSAFVTADTNKDGFVSKAELDATQARQATQRKAEFIRAREAAFRRLDANADGSLTLQEFNSVAAATPVPEADASPILTRFDTNKDGKVSAAENSAPALADFDRADTNKDGILSVQEQRVAPR